MAHPETTLVELPFIVRVSTHRNIVFLFTSRGCALDDVNTCVELLRETRLRAEFVVALGESCAAGGFVVTGVRSHALQRGGDGAEAPYYKWTAN